MLSMNRRLGAQLAPEQINGCAQRHALGWRELGQPQVENVFDIYRVVAREMLAFTAVGCGLVFATAVGVWAICV
jgi:hypothetical protein